MRAACLLVMAALTPSLAFTAAAALCRHRRHLPVRCQLEPGSGLDQLFSELFTKGGMAVHEGDMPTALYWLQQAAKVDPNNAQCQKMVARLEGLGIEPKEPPSVG